MDPSLVPAARAFDPAFLGTPNHLWEEALQRMPALSLPNAPIVVVSPHPDDEVLGAGGLIRTAALAGYGVTILSVTDGEAAYSDWLGLRGIRCREVEDALSVMGSPEVGLQRLRIPDGHVGRHEKTLVDAIEQSVSPGTLLVAPYERDGHPDHDAAGEVCAAVAKSRGLTLWRYPIWLWHHGAPQACLTQSWGCLNLDAAAVAAKTEAMHCFTSQLCPSGREPVVPSHVLPYFSRTFEAYLL